MMDHDEAAAMARQLIHKHVPNERYPWTFGWDNAKRRFGCCWPSAHRITLSRHLVELNDWRAVRETILHEIAHAVAFEHDGSCDHGKSWKVACTIVGAKPERCYDSDVATPPRTLPHRWIGVCPKCDQVRARRRYLFDSRRYRQQSCAECSRNGKFDLECVLEWRTNPAFLEAGGKP